MKPFDPEFNRAILELAPAHIARDAMPEFTAATPWQALAELQTRDGLLVYAGASEQTIYACPRVNHAFRAWHDAAHIAARAGFDLAGEWATCEEQVSQLLRRFPSAPARWVKLIRAEIIGQAEFFTLTGSFPEDQTAFIRYYIEENSK